MPHPSVFPSLFIPDIDLWSLLFSQNDRVLSFPVTKNIITCGNGSNRSYSWADLRNGSIEFGKGLQAQWGWKKGDVMALYTPNSIDTPVVTLGAIWAGGIVSPANPLYTVDELAFQLKDSGAKGLVTQVPFLKIAVEAARKAGIPNNRIILLGDRRDDPGRFEHFSGIRQKSPKGQYVQAKISNPDEDLVFLVYSSGTTGLPKGVCLSHRNIVANVLQTNYVEGGSWHSYGGVDGNGDKQLGVLPFFHIFGLTCCMLFSIYAGLELVVLERFEIEKVLQTIQNSGITFMFIAPPIVLAFAKHPLVDNYDLTSLKAVHSGAAPLSRELTEAVWNRLQIPVKQGFGLSETSPVSHCQTTTEWAKFMGSIGKLIPNMESKIVDEDGKEVADGETGELWLKGPNIFKGYLNNPERTKEAFSSDGYFKTGDVLRRDKYGNYYCVDRVKELIKYNGFPVPPAELEGVLLGHPEVVDVCVIGVEDRALATEVPRAYVVLRPGILSEPVGLEVADAKAQELAAWVATKVAPHKRLRGGVHFVAQVPKSASGKILRRLVRDRAREEERAAGAKL
ncbi:hypothetical protein B0T19DRAFT_33157 [Cercophora scortea]|uniref:Phenylacetyl-CoA ligase n=1 Tax=Cercophora scortea TaxID=314031 RepID=A0AAE0MKW1_9PEZI|nr:hypothetical protein B0T19DRAFT_33157 [Cercophora scortea]